MRNPLAPVAMSVLFSVSALLVASCATQGAQQISKIVLSGARESPPVHTSATGSGQISVSADRSISGSVTTSGVEGMAAHIHDAAPGKNGPVVVPLKKVSEGVWSVPEGARLSDSQYMSYQAGNLYINVHSATNPGGEIRGQIIPPSSIQSQAVPASTDQPASPALGGYAY
jgi:hypothetical protein